MIFIFYSIVILVYLCIKKKFDMFDLQNYLLKIDNFVVKFRERPKPGRYRVRIAVNLNRNNNYMMLFLS